MTALPKPAHPSQDLAKVLVQYLQLAARPVFSRKVPNFIFQSLYAARIRVSKWTVSISWAPLSAFHPEESQSTSQTTPQGSITHCWKAEISWAKGSCHSVPAALHSGGFRKGRITYPPEMMNTYILNEPLYTELTTQNTWNTCNLPLTKLAGVQRELTQHIHFPGMVLCRY